MILQDLNHIVGGRVVLVNSDWERIGDELNISNFRFTDLWSKKVSNISASIDMEMFNKYGVDSLYSFGGHYTMIELDC